jgi:CheY-like chemotaxis protein
MPLHLKSLSTELTVVFASIVAVLVVSLTYFAFDLASHAQEETVRRDLQNTVDQAVFIVDNELNERSREVRTATLSPTIRDAVSFMSDRHEKIPADDLNELALRDRFNGVGCIQDRPEISRQLEAMKSAHSYGSEFMVTDKFGVTVGCTSDNTNLFNANSFWWQETVARGRSLSNLEKDPETDGYVYSVSLHIYDGSDAPTGVLRATFDLDAIQKSLGAIRIGDHGFLVGMTRDGRVFAHPTAKYLWKEIQEAQELAFLADVVASGGPRGYAIYEPYKKPDEGTGATDGDVSSDDAPKVAKPTPAGRRRAPSSLASASEESWILAYGRTLRPASLGSLGWTVVGTVSRSEVIAPISAVGKRVAIIGGSLIVLAVLMVWLVSRRLARPLNDLAQRADLIAAGDLSVRLAVPSRNEIARLASALSSMVDSLRDSNKSLAQANANLESIVARRTRELEEKTKLLEKQSEAVLETSRLKSQFLANMSHELRTPLNAVMALSEILGQRISGDLNDEQVKQVNLINRSGRNLLRLINDILDLSKIEAGRLEVYLAVFEVRGTIAAVRDTINPLASEKGLNFEIHVDPALPACIRSDDDKIRQVLVNLLGNAIKFTHAGTVSLTMSKRFKSLPGSDDLPPPMTDEGPFWLELKVTDTGIGISEEALKTIFDEFQQADGSATRKYGGSGLGLAISKRMTELMGGELTVTSREGEGSTFAIQMPVDGVASDKHSTVVSVQPGKLESGRSPMAGVGGLGSDPGPKSPLVPGSSHGVAGGQGDGNNQPDPGVRRGELTPEQAKRTWVTPLREHPVPISPRFLDIRDDTHNLLPHIPTLLVVDDDPESLYVYRQFLSRKGYQVIFAINGEQVIDKARQFKPVAIILDLMLPQKSGWEVLEEMKTTDDVKHIPVIIASVLDHRERGVCAGAFRYLTKPMSEKQLSGVLEELEKDRKKDVRRVLVIDDDPVEIGIAKTLFAKAGLDVIAIQDGADAVEWAAKEKPDFIVLDLMMPGIDGFDVLSMLKENPESEPIPVLVYTAMDVTEEDKKRLLPKARRIFPKVPLQIEEMLDELQKALQDLPGSPEAQKLAAQSVVIDEKERLVRPTADGGLTVTEGGARPAENNFNSDAPSPDHHEGDPPAADTAPVKHLQDDVNIDTAPIVPLPPDQSDASPTRTGRVSATTNPGLEPDGRALKLQRAPDYDGHETGPVHAAASVDPERVVASSGSEASLAHGTIEESASSPAVTGESFRARILLVEDDPANQYSLSFLLRSRGYKVLKAENGEEGIQVADAERPDLILMDMMMPVMSGFDATRHLKNSPELCKIPVIALTAAAMRGDRERTLAAGCDDYVSKPVDRKELLERVEHWLKMAGALEPVGHA